jgi:opacity protein-like surface antigen
MKRIVLGGIAVASLAVTGPAISADLPPATVYKAPVATLPPAWFVEGRLGATFGLFDDLKFLNPIGTAFTSNAISGNFIILNDRQLSDTSFTGGASVGYFFENRWFAKVSYQYFGSFQASGFANFPGVGNFRQDLNTKAHGLLAGIGRDFDIANALFVEPIVEIGVGFLSSTGQQGANLGTPNNFPSQRNTNFIAGGGLGVGYHVSRSIDLLVSGNYYWLGKADTGVTPNPPPAGMNPGEQLQANLSVVTLTIGARAKF